MLGFPSASPDPLRPPLHSKESPGCCDGRSSSRVGQPHRTRPRRQRALQQPRRARKVVERRDADGATMDVPLQLGPIISEESERKAAVIMEQIRAMGAGVFFEKPLTASDTSGSGRVVIPKVSALSSCARGRVHAGRVTRMPARAGRQRRTRDASALHAWRRGALRGGVRARVQLACSVRLLPAQAIAEQYFPRLEMPSGLPVRAVDIRGHEYQFKFRRVCRGAHRAAQRPRRVPRSCQPQLVGGACSPPSGRAILLSPPLPQVLDQQPVAHVPAGGRGAAAQPVQHVGGRRHGQCP